jgi:hypothetical protein
MGALTEALTRYQHITRELASLYKQRGELRKLQVETKRDAFLNGPADSVTARRENAAMAAAEWDRDLYKLQADIEANEVELRYLDQHIAAIKYIGKGHDGDTN